MLREVLAYARAPVTALEALAKTDGQRYELDALSDLVFEIHQLTDWDHGVIEVDGDWYAAWTGDADAIARIIDRANAAVGDQSTSNSSRAGSREELAVRLGGMDDAPDVSPIPMIRVPMIRG